MINGCPVAGKRDEIKWEQKSLSIAVGNGAPISIMSSWIICLFIKIKSILTNLSKYSPKMDIVNDFKFVFFF